MTARPIEDIDAIKRGGRAGSARYALKNADVFVSPGGFHFISYLDPVGEIDPRIDGAGLTEETVGYIERQLQYNPHRFENQVAAVTRHVDPAGKSALDIGCGGGLFLAKLRDAGAGATAIELADDRAAYASRTYGFEVVKRAVEDPYWDDVAGTFDVVTLWDVIEHVNYPHATLAAAVRLLKPGGFLFIDTPCRDAFYHRVGEWTYRLSGGRFPTFLDAMYSAHPFGHKQIFATWEMQAQFERLGLETRELVKFHELSFPHEFYLRKLLKFEWAVTLATPVVGALFKVFPIRNKMLAVGRKPSAGPDRTKERDA